MKLFLPLLLFLFLQPSFAQKTETQILLKDKISIRALEIWDGKVWYSGTDAKFGYVNLKDSADRKQMMLSDKKLQFRTLAQDSKSFYTINIESPARFFKIDKKSLKKEVIFTDMAKNAFYDALHFTGNGTAYAFSDPDESLDLKIAVYEKGKWKFLQNSIKLEKGEAAFAASNTNIASSKKYLWVATGGETSRILRMNRSNGKWEIFRASFIQGMSSQGIYSIDFYGDRFGVAVGGDYTKQTENINNIATTNDGGKTWQIQASGKNGGYKTCVKIRPQTKGKEMVALGDQNVEISRDYGKTWTIISEEKGLYVFEWMDRNTLVAAGKDRIVKMSLKF